MPPVRSSQPKKVTRVSTTDLYCSDGNEIDLLVTSKMALMLFYVSLKPASFTESTLMAQYFFMIVLYTLG